MALTTTSDFNPVLTELLNKIGSNRFVGTRIAPIRTVQTKSGVYPVFDSDQFDNDASKERAPGSNAARMDFGYSQDDFTCKQYMLEGLLPDEDRSKASDDGISDAEAQLAMLLQRNLMVGHERRVKDLLYPGTSPFNSENATAVMSSTADAKPITDIQKAVQRLNANGHFDGLAVIIEDSLYYEMINTDDFRDITNGASSYPNENLIRGVLGVNEIIVCTNRYNSAKKGQNASRTKVWPDNKYLVASIAGGDFAAGGFARTLAYAPDGGAFTAETYREETKKSDVLRVFNSLDEVIINSTAAELIATV